MEDPTQPVVDVTNQGSDMVVEPSAEVKRIFSLARGRTESSVKAQGFVFATKAIYNHATFRFEIEQDLTRFLMLRVNYYYAPDLLLARNVQRSTGIVADERVSTHIYSAHLEGRPSEDLTLRLLTRYGSRDYNAAFQNRDTTLWTVGPHVEWAAARWLDVTAGYHYERGLADGRTQPQSKDDVSFINHYLALGLMFKPAPQYAVFLGGDYEHNIFTSTLAGDERQGRKELPSISGSSNSAGPSTNARPSRPGFSARCGFPTSPRAPCRTTTRGWAWNAPSSWEGPAYGRGWNFSARRLAMRECMGSCSMASTEGSSLRRTALTGSMPKCRQTFAARLKQRENLPGRVRV